VALPKMPFRMAQAPSSDPASQKESNPIGWSELNPSEMEWYRNQRGRRGKPSSTGMIENDEQLNLEVG
jgi:hypothetical protein